MGCFNTKHLHEIEDIDLETLDLEALRMDTKLVSIANLYISYNQPPGMYLDDEDVAFGYEKAEVPRDLVKIPHRKEEYHLIIGDLYDNEILTRRQAGILTQICCTEIPAGIKIDCMDEDIHIFTTTRFIMDRLYEELGGGGGSNYEYWRGIVPLFEYIFQLKDVQKQEVVWANNEFCRRYADKHVNLVETTMTKNLPMELVQSVFQQAFTQAESESLAKTSSLIGP